MRTLIFVSLLGLLAVRATAQSYTINKFAIAGGGGTGTGGVYAVSGTIGQADVSGPLSGGTYTLVGGFWALPSAVQTPGAPLLSVSLNPQLSTINISWPLPATGFVLDQAISLVSPPATNAWSQVAFPYQTNATHVFITVPPSGNKFYRLRHP